MKTYKRELAVALFIPLFYTVWQGDSNMAQVLVWPTFTFAALSFGLDWHGKQLRNEPTQSTNGRWPERSGQYPSSQDSQPDSRNYEDNRPADH